ncbi:hypothetical protein BHM03_00054030 [Ensete ventricosum]|nr:hypothetical protein BHM03_00054030 [Ensete ventricosum]
MPPKIAPWQGLLFHVVPPSTGDISLAATRKMEKKRQKKQGRRKRKREKRRETFATGEPRDDTADKENLARR